MERLVGSIRRESLDHAIVLDVRHLRHIRTGYFDCDHRWRTHQGLGMDCSDGRGIHPAGQGPVVETEHLDGLHQHHERAAA